MAFYICHQCASAHALRRGLLRIIPFKASEVPKPRFLNTTRSRPDQLSKTPNGHPANRTKAATTNAATRSSPCTVPTSALTSSSASSFTPTSASDTVIAKVKARAQALDPERAEHIEATRRRIDQLVKHLEVDALYLEFWKICCTETIDDQRLIWHDEGIYPGDARQEGLYRAFNSPNKPHHSSYPSDRLLVRGKRIPASMFTVKGDQITPLPRPGIIISPKAEPTFNYHSIRFIPRSHVKRLLQIHHYFEQVLELTTGYYAKIALVVALSSAGDIITVQKLFTSWQGRPQKEKRHYAEGSRTGGKSEAGGKEMYSAVIRGLVGRNFRDHERRPYYVSVDHKTGSRNNGVTQMHAALELFYDLLRKGGTPTFETYHSLVVGLAAFKNDMEAAELLLDHMIITKRKPYVQVLHVMCREYVRRKDYPRAERIFNMLREYGIRPKALTCNLMIRAVFRMSSLEALQYLGQTQGIHLNAAETTTAQVSEDLGTMARQLKRQRIRGILEYMQRNNTLPDQDTFSTLMYGYGHMEDGYPDLKETMVEMSREQYRIEPSLIVLNSLLFAHLNHGRVKIAESILDQMLSTPHPVKDRVAVTNRQPQQQESSPFRRSRQIVEEPEEWSDAAMDDEKNRSPRRAIYDNMMMIPGKGTFHALMLAHVERGDILGMERVLDKMIQAQKQQQEQQQELQIRHRSMPRALRRPIPPMIDLGGDEYTANIMLLGYLAQRDFAKVDMIQKQIQARPDWKSSSMFQDRQESRTQMIEFVRQQSSKAVVERSLRQNNDEDDPLISRTLTWISSESSTPSKKAGDPLIGDVEGELDDDIEIDVTTLSAKLRELMKSSSPTTTTTSTSTSSISSSQSSPPTSSAHE